MLFAWQQRAPQSYFEVLGPFGMLFIGLLVLGIVLIVARRWFQQNQKDEITANEMLAEFRNLEEEGELSPEEFKKIKDVLGEKLRSEFRPKK